MSEQKQPVDPAAIRALLDQFSAMLRDLAPVIAGFWVELVKGGMAPDAATAVVQSFLLTVLSSLRKQ